ncbi:MAG: GH32 C-terminal domain-containing protein, partial [Muribaculaceae bacterium]|nr:GH32 C-terminal domain-containing protein [Muribaculaceae bacterium]
KDNYATVSWSDAPDGRRTVIGWMSNWQYAAEVPTKQFRSANTLPREVSLFRGADGQVYAATAPSPEIDAVRGKAAVSSRNIALGSKGKVFALPKENDGVCEIELTVNPRDAKTVTMTLSNTAGNKVVMAYDPAAGTFSTDRRESGVTDFSQEFPAVTAAPVFATDKELTLRVFVDRSSIEVFGNGGRFAMTNLVFPETPYSTLTLASDGGKAKASLKVYPVVVKD